MKHIAIGVALVLPWMWLTVLDYFLRRPIPPHSPQRRP